FIYSNRFISLYVSNAFKRCPILFIKYIKKNSTDNDMNIFINRRKIPLILVNIFIISKLTPLFSIYLLFKFITPQYLISIACFIMFLFCLSNVCITLFNVTILFQ